MIKWLIAGLIAFIGIYCSYKQYENKGILFTILGVATTVALSIFATMLYNIIIDPYISGKTEPETTVLSTNDYASDENLSGSDGSVIWNDTVASEAEKDNVSTSEGENSTGFKDISGVTEVSGSIDEENQKNCYKYTARVSGTYRFFAELSSGGGVRIRICGENGDSINSGNDALTINLEQGKTYILSIEYRNGICKYTVNIGVPIPITDITGRTCVSGNITYQDQIDKYYYTAPVSGTYRFDTDLSAGGGVWVRISGENENSLDSRSDALTINLEEGKTYILSIEYRNGVCEYTVNIGVPIPITDITGETCVSGNITYQDQNDKYYYTASVGGKYRFDTELSAGGGVWVCILGENGNSLDYRSDALTVDLEEGKTYILSIEYRNGVCEYTVKIGVPIPITDVTGETCVSGNITYQDQNDRYYYTASTSGTYCFDTNLSAGGGVWVCILGENGNSLDYGSDTLTVNLEAGKKYIVSVEFRNAPCSYDLMISSP